MRLWSCIIVASYAVRFNSNAGSKQGTNGSVGFLLIVIQLGFSAVPIKVD